MENLGEVRKKGRVKTHLKLLFLVASLNLTAFGQQHFRFTNISKKYDVDVTTERMEYTAWRGKTKVQLFRKGASRPFQIIHLKDTQILIDDNGKPEIARVKDKENGKWSSVYLEDFDFDGFDDLAVADGDNGGYRGTSYSIYLFDRTSVRFKLSPSFTRLGQGPYIGIPEIDTKKKTLEVFWKSGYGFYQIERYSVSGKKPRKIYEHSESTAINDGNRYITTKKLINGKWRVWNKAVRDTLK